MSYGKGDIFAEADVSFQFFPPAIAAEEAQEIQR